MESAELVQAPFALPATAAASPEPGAPESSWHAFYRRWRRLQPPLRPHADVCASMRGLLAGHGSRLLLLGVTPELAGLGASTVAIDWSGTTMARIWPGNTPASRAVQGNWLDLPCAAGSFSGAIGDGSLSCLEYPAGYARLFQELARVVRPGGRIVVRLYATPDRCESLAGVRDAAMTGAVGSIHALKWRLANAVCAANADPNIPVRRILGAFNRQFPDRETLRIATGWTAEDINQVDAYLGMADAFSFPTTRQVLSMLPRRLANARLVPSGSYELAARCPLLVIDVPTG